jgi:hypothetical protein
MVDTPVRLYYRVHEWLADHVKWVQYPHVSGPVNSTPKPPLLAWRYDMPLGSRILLALLSLFGVIVFGGILIAILMIAWAFFGAALGFH